VGVALISKVERAQASKRTKDTLFEYRALGLKPVSWVLWGSLLALVECDLLWRADLGIDA
jgi:hypothetical protein